MLVKKVDLVNQEEPKPLYLPGSNLEKDQLSSLEK